MGPSVWASVALGNVGASVKASLGVHIIHGEGCGAGPGGGINQTFKSKGGGGRGYVWPYMSMTIMVGLVVLPRAIMIA
jgi:hypothetical protein